MNLGEYLANIILEAGDQPEQTIALFPGAFKPPHKGHFDVVEKLLKAADQVVVLVSPKMREGINADESVAVWNLYKPLFDGSVEVRVAAGDSPVGEVYDVVKNNPDTNFIVAFGKGEMDRYKNIEKYPNVKVFDAGAIEGVSATNLRMALLKDDSEEIAQYLPEKVSVDEFLQALGKQPKEEKPEEVTPPPSETPTETPPVVTETKPTLSREDIERRRQYELKNPVVKSETNVFPISGTGGFIPLSIAKKAHDYYYNNIDKQPFKMVWSRGGFGVKELDQFYPQWRQEVFDLINKKYDDELASINLPPEGPLFESPPINFDEPPYQNYILANRRKIEQAAAVFNLPIDDMEYAFNGGSEVVLNDDMWSEMENTKSYNMKSLEDAISHALKTGINPKPYIDAIKKKEDIPLPLVLQYHQNKYYLVGGEVILSIYRSLGVIPTVLLGTLNLQTKTLPEPIHEAHEQIISDEDVEFSRVAKEFDIPKKKLIQIFKKGEITKLTNNIWSKLENTDSWDVESEEDAIKLAKKYGKKWESTLAAIKADKKINPPLILKYDKGKYHLVGGNTRLMFYKVLGINPKVLVATLPESLNEGIDSDGDKKLLKKFIGFAIKELGIQKPPTGLTLSNDNSKAKSRHTFGVFNPNNDKIWLYVKNRNMADLLRTLAHELVHRKQAEDGRLEPNSGDTGSEIENEANAQAGVLLRKFGKQNEEIYQ